MANYYASARSNYFRVKDPVAFEKDLPPGIEEITWQAINDKDYCCLLFNEEGIPTEIYNEETDHYNVFDWADYFSKHLEKNSVAIFMEAGAEKLHYINGVATAYNSRGDTIQVSLNDIYREVIDNWSIDVELTRAEY